VFSEILKIIPRLDNKDLNTMEKSLSSRFSRIAKGFGKVLKVSLLASFGASVLQKLLSPLNEVREAIDRTLKSADDVVTNAGQFGTTTEKLLKLRALGGLKGLQPEQLDLLLTKFQTGLAQAQANPNDPAVSSLKNFVGKGDTADAFFSFIQSLQKTDPAQRLLIQEQVFGEKQILKMSEFLQSNFSESLGELSKVDFSTVARAVESIEKNESTNTKNATLRGLQDYVNKARVINPGTIDQINATEVQNLKRENDRIGNFKNAAKVEENINKISDNIEKLVNQTITELPIIMESLNVVVDLLKTAVSGWKDIFDFIKKSPAFKGIKSLFGKGE